MHGEPWILTDARIGLRGGTGPGGAFKIGDTVTATWNNTAGSINLDIASVSVNFSQFGGGAAVTQEMEDALPAPAPLAGKALLVVSVELDEINALADRILVMHDGRIVGDMPRAAATEQTLGLLMAGVTEPSPRNRTLV